MENILEDIISWHKKTFPDATLKGQLLKIEEELNEFRTAENNKESEYADVLITCIVGALRFDSIVASYILRRFNFNENCLNLISKKMEINKKRKWEKIGDIYKHKED